MGGGLCRKAGAVLWERQAERMQGGHAGSVLLEGSQRGQQSSGTLQTKQQRGGSRRGEEEGSEGLTEEEEAGTRLTLRPCRMHKAGTRRETSK